MRKYQLILKWTWICLLTATIVMYFVQPHWFHSGKTADWIRTHEENMRLVYILFVLLRFVLFIPSTVAIIIGIALFPDEPYFLLTINMIGILLGSYALYLAGRTFTPDDFFSTRKRKSLPWVKEKLNAHGFYIVLVWSFFPLVPTDLMCFVAGTTKMDRFKFLSAMFIGELILVYVYIFTGKALFDHFI